MCLISENSFFMIIYLRIKMGFFDVHRVMKPVGGAEIP